MRMLRYVSQCTRCSLVRTVHILLRMLMLPRHCGDRGVVLDYRHVIDHLLRKPGAFERYRYREQLYPSRSFREAHDHLVAKHGQRGGRWSICGCSNWPAKLEKATSK